MMAGPWVESTPPGTWIRRYNTADAAAMVRRDTWIAWRPNTEGGGVIDQGRWALESGEDHAKALADAALRREGRLAPDASEVDLERQVAELRGRVAELLIMLATANARADAFESSAKNWEHLAEMACEFPPPGCRCPGCSEAQRIYGAPEDDA